MDKIIYSKIWKLANLGKNTLTLDAAGILRKQILTPFQCLNILTLIVYSQLLRNNFSCKNLDFNLTGKFRKFAQGCPKFRQGVESLGKGVRSLGRVSEVRTWYPSLCK